MNMIATHRRMDANKLIPRAFQKARRLARPFTPWPARPGAFAGQCSAITSLSPNPKRLARQMHCLQSWLDIGLDVIAVNTPDEISDLYFPPGVLAYPSDDVTTAYDRPTQRISALVNVGIETDLPFFLVNSDIEIHGHTQVIAQALQAGDQLTIGVRYNYDGASEAKLEAWGLDIFGMTPAMARTLPSMPFGIGKPVWDYWLPHHFRSHGFGFHWINSPFFFHQTHSVLWSQKEWLYGAEALRLQYGLSLVHDCAAFRESLVTDISNLKSQISNFLTLPDCRCWISTPSSLSGW